MVERISGSRSTTSKKKRAAQTRKRGRGTGGIVAIRDGVWRIDIEVKRDPITGQRRRVSRTVYGTRDEAEVTLARLRVAGHENRLVIGGTKARSVDAVFSLYQQAIQAGTIELAPSTAMTTRGACKRMAETRLESGQRFGDVTLNRLTWQEIESLYSAMRAAGMGVDWIRRCATVLTRALELARKRGLLDSNPAKDASRPRSTRSKPFSPSADEVRKLLAVATKRDAEIADAVTVLVSTGMRRGELLALRWSDIDFKKDEVNVSAAITDGGRGVGILRKATKRADWRDVPLTQGAVDALRRQAERRRKLIGSDPPLDDYVFPRGIDGSLPLRPDTMGDRWAAARGKSRITLQHLRHYAATAMLDAGESYRTVADILGNSEATLRLHYDGRNDTGKRQAIAALELGTG
ncbi:MAG: site-specific integrase [Microthrixaceae bacterium]